MLFKIAHRSVSLCKQAIYWENMRDNGRALMKDAFIQEFSKVAASPGLDLATPALMIAGSNAPCWIRRHVWLSSTRWVPLRAPDW